MSGLTIISFKFIFIFCTKKFTNLFLKKFPLKILNQFEIYYYEPIINFQTFY